MRMKGIALTTIAYMILALITIIVIISLIGENIYPSMRKVYCSILRGIRAIIPLSNQLKPDVPSFCQIESVIKIETVEVETSNPDRIAFLIAAYMTACWEKTGKIDVGQDKICYEIVIKNINGIVDQTKIMNNLNNVPFVWVKDIDRPTSVAIIYNSAQNKIIVE